MKLTNYRKIADNIYKRKVLWLESRIFCRNSPWRMWLRRMIR